MLRIKNLSLKTRFLITPILAIILTLALFLAGNYVLDRNQSTFTHLHNSDMPLIGKINRLSIILSSNHNRLSQLLLKSIEKPDEEVVYEESRVILYTLYEIEKELQKVIEEMDTDSGQVFDIKQPFHLYRSTIIHVIEISTVNAKLANRKLGEASTALQGINQRLIKISDYSVKRMESDVNLIEDSMTSHQWLPYVAFIILLFMVFISLSLANRMSKDLQSFTQVLSLLSRGKTHVVMPEIDDRYLDPLKKASLAFKQSLQQNQQQKAELEQIIIDLKDSQNRTETLLDVVPNAIIAIDHNQKIVLFNQMAEKLFGYPNERIVNQEFTQLFSPDSRFNASEKVATLFGQPDSQEIQIDSTTMQAITQDNTEFTIEMQLAKMQLSSETILIAAISDVTQRKIHEEMIWNQAHYDDLTQLPNRTFSIKTLEEKINNAKAYSKQLAILFMDLDDFKKVNDSLGHETGDKLLIETAKRLKENTREADFVGRLGGDEFILLFEDNHIHNILKNTVRGIVHAFNKPIQTQNRKFISTLSIGTAIYPDDGKQAFELLKKADMAMYAAKRLGRNRHCQYSQEIDEQFNRIISIEEQIHYGLEHDEFSLHYQPQFNINTNQLVGMEALLRWNNRVLGNVSPNEFVKIAEQTGQIGALGEFVIRQALQQLKDWQAEFAIDDIKMSINLSPAQFMDQHIVAKLEQLLSDSDVAPKNLNLEVTEGVFLKDTQQLDKLSAFKALGISLSMDDFGTGYSSLSYIQKYPFDWLKIDRSFIDNCAKDNSSDQQLVKAIIAMAKSLNLGIVAEGVATQEQLEFLKIMNVSVIQGYLYGKPAAASEFADLFLKQYNQ